MFHGAPVGHRAGAGGLGCQGNRGGPPGHAANAAGIVLRASQGEPREGERAGAWRPSDGGAARPAAARDPRHVSQGSRACLVRFRPGRRRHRAGDGGRQSEDRARGPRRRGASAVEVARGRAGARRQALGRRHCSGGGSGGGEGCRPARRERLQGPAGSGHPGRDADGAGGGRGWGWLTSPGFAPPPAAPCVCSRGFRCLRRRCPQDAGPRPAACALAFPPVAADGPPCTAPWSAASGQCG